MPVQLTVKFEVVEISRTLTSTTEERGTIVICTLKGGGSIPLLYYAVIHLQHEGHV